MGKRWEPGVVVKHAETPRSYKCKQMVVENATEIGIKILMKLPFCGPTSTRRLIF